jgi:hypothetical protein
MVAFVRAVGALITEYENIKRTASNDQASRAEVACDAALEELGRLSIALRQLRRSLHGAPAEPDLPRDAAWTATARESSTSIPPGP